MSPFGDGPFGDGAFGDDLVGGPGPQPGAPEGLALRIGPRTDALQYLFYRSWRIQEQLNGRNTCSCTLLAADGFAPVRGQEFVLSLTEQGVTTILFAGSIFERKVRFLSEGRNDYVLIELECTDWNRLADRRKIGEVYEGKTLGFIVRDIVAQTLAAEGLTANGVEEGPVLTKVVFPNLSVQQAFDQLSEATGYYFNIDYLKDLKVFQRTSSQAPFAIVNGVNAVFRDFREAQSLAQYRNSEFVDGGKGLTALRTESFKGDGTRRSWDTEYPLASMPTLYINSIQVDPARIGIRGVEDDKAFYWAKGETAVGQAASVASVTQPPLTATDILTVQYIGLFDIATEIIDFAKVAERQAIEGGTGLYEHVHVEDSLDGADVVAAKGLGLLKRYGLSSDVEFETDADGLAIGQELPITISELGITNQPYLITAMEIESLVLSERRYRVRASTGEVKDTFKTFWQKVFEKNPITIREEAVVQTVSPLFETAMVGEVLTATLADYADRDWGDSEMGVDEWANP